MPKPNVILMTTVVAVLASACQGADVDIAIREQALSSAVVDLLGTATCKLKLNKLRDCAIAPGTLAATPLDTAIPVRTVVTRVKSGNCATPYPVQVTLTPNAGAPVVLTYLSQDRAEIRAPEGANIANLTIADSSPWTGTLILDPSCSVHLKVSFNELDIDSKEEAEAALYRIQTRLDAAVQLRDRYRELMLFARAYGFMHQVAQSFHTELTNDLMQELRAAALASAPSLEVLITSCGEMADDDRENLLRLYFAMGVLGDPASWQNPDGTTKTLAEFLGSEAAQVIATVEGALAAAGTTPGADYEALYQQAALEVERVEAQLALAHAQLAAWL
jgi:hypothetical protein